MAIITLLPNSTETTHTSHWQVYGEATHHECLDDDNGDTSYVTSSTNSHRIILDFANPTVAEGDIDTIDTVQFVSVGKSSHRSQPSIVTISFAAPAGVSAYSEICSYDAHRTNWEPINGTVRTTSDGIGGTAWTYSDLEDLEMLCNKLLTIEVHLSYLAIKISYTAAVTDNAVFFGANF